MNRQIALAYGIAGLAVAIAFVTVVGTTLGFDEPVALTPEPTPSAVVAPQVAAELPPEIVYVDEPVRRGGHREREHEEREEDEERGEHEDHGDDD